MQLVGIVPTDAAILQRLGEMYDAEGDKSQAFQYHYDVSRKPPLPISRLFFFLRKHTVKLTEQTTVPVSTIHPVKMREVKLNK